MTSVLWHWWLGGRKGIRPIKNMGRCWRWALVSPDEVAPSRMVNVSASVNLPLHCKVQKFSSGTGSPGKKGRKTDVVWYRVKWNANCWNLSTQGWNIIMPDDTNAMRGIWSKWQNSRLGTVALFSSAASVVHIQCRICLSHLQHNRHLITFLHY